MNLQQQVQNELGPTDSLDDELPYTLWEGNVSSCPLRIYHPPEIFTAEGVTPDSAKHVIVVIPTNLSLDLRIDPDNFLRRFFQTLRHLFYSSNQISIPGPQPFIAYSDRVEEAESFLSTNTNRIRRLIDVFHHIEVTNDYSAQAKLFCHDEESLAGLNEILVDFVEVFATNDS